MKKTMSLVALVLGLASVGHAATIVSDTADGGVKTNGTFTQNGPGDYAVRVGEFFGPSQSFVAPFQLPALPVGEVFTSATIQFRLYEKIGTITYNLDLYALTNRANSGSSALETGDANEGPTDATNAILIGDNFLTPASPFQSGAGADPANATKVSGAGEEAALLSFLNSQYLANGAGSYVFFRLSPDDAVPNNNNAYSILTQNAGALSERPQITYTSAVVAVPEPATFGLLGLAAVGVLGRRGRESR